MRLEQRMTELKTRSGLRMRTLRCGSAPSEEFADASTDKNARRCD